MLARERVHDSKSAVRPAHAPDARPGPVGLRPQRPLGARTAGMQFRKGSLPLDRRRRLARHVV